jgi:putative addiction module component (TIGR02574 family)
MSLTLDQIVEETRQLPADTVAELVDRIMLAKHGADDEPLSPAWRATLRRRVEDIRSGREPGLDGEEVMARARQLVGR